ncbi:MAG: HD domain-containing phosphohydrolase, partial [Lentisphaerota bacterium]
MRLSDFIKKGPAQKEAAGVVDAPQAPAHSPPPSAPVRGPVVREDPAAETQYVNIPHGIYQAAAELGITVPRTRESIIDRAVNCLIMVFSKVSGAKGEMETIWPMIQSIAAELSSMVGAGENLAPPLYAKMNPTERLCWHSVYTSIFAMDLAVGVSGLDITVPSIGGAALIHDIGFLRMQKGLEHLMDEQNAKFAEHVYLGAEIAREIRAPAEVITVISQHHERNDGLGFPARIAREEFTRNSQVLALANIVEMALAKNNSAPGAMNGGGVTSILDVLVEYRKAFDYDLLKAVLSHKGFYNIGALVVMD